jgi:hypothetical protein
MIGTGPNDGLVIYGDQATTPLLFSGDITLDYTSGSPMLGFGSILSGAELFNTYLFQTGDRANQNPVDDPLVFIGSNRTLTAVPEPSALLLGLGVLASMLVRSRSRRIAMRLP